MSKQKAIIVSGYFNPIHKGHLEYFNNAKAMADQLFVIVNNDHQRELKGSREFQDENERMIIVSNIKAVDKAILSIDTDRTVCGTIKMIAEQFGEEFDLGFANGGDQNNETIPERSICEQMNVALIDCLRNCKNFKMKIALITGITGQDGSFLAEFLVKKGYEVHGIIRRSSSFNTERIEHLYIEELISDLHSKMKIHLHYGDMTDSSNLIRLIQKIKPFEIYNLAAQSHVKASFDLPEYTAETDGIGTLRLLEAVRICGLDKVTKIYQASTSELYGKVQEIPQSETTPFYPRSPYGVAKMYAFWITKNYRESYGMFAVNQKKL